MLHRFPDESAFDRRRQLAELAYVASSTAAATALAENYVGPADGREPAWFARLAHSPGGIRRSRSSAYCRRIEQPFEAKSSHPDPRLAGVGEVRVGMAMGRHGALSGGCGARPPRCWRSAGRRAIGRGRSRSRAPCCRARTATSAPPLRAHADRRRPRSGDRPGGRRRRGAPDAAAARRRCTRSSRILRAPRPT